MNIVKKLISFIKNKFTKHEKIKKLMEPRIIANEDKKESFIESLKINATQKITKKRIETLICNGDGLGIQKNITY